MWLSRFRLGWFRLWSIWLSQVAAVVQTMVVVVLEVFALVRLL
jgi:hypothetical protein